MTMVARIRVCMTKACDCCVPQLRSFIPVRPSGALMPFHLRLSGRHRRPRRRCRVSSPARASRRERACLERSRLEQQSVDLRPDGIVGGIGLIMHEPSRRARVRGLRRLPRLGQGLGRRRLGRRRRKGIVEMVLEVRGLPLVRDGPDQYRLLGLRAAACATGTGPDPAKERLYPRSGPHANMLWPARGGHASDPRRTRVLLVCCDLQWGPLVPGWGPPILGAFSTSGLGEKTNLAAMCSYQSTDQPTFSLRTLPPEAASPSCRHSVYRHRRRSGRVLQAMQMRARDREGHCCLVLNRPRNT